MKYTIKKIDETTGNVDVSFDKDNKVQTIAGLDLTDADLLKQQIEDYGRAYGAGLDAETHDIPQDVKSLVNKEQTIEEKKG